MSWLDCRLCGRRCGSPGGLHKHVSESHGLDAWTYYNLFIDALRGRVRDSVRVVAVVEGLTACWAFQGSCGRGGYGKMRVNGSPTAALHRLSYFAHTGEMPPSDEYLLHACDNPPCCNPDHLRPGTPTENVAERIERGRSSNGTKHYNARFSVDEVYDIRQRATWGWSSAALAERYGVGSESIRRLVIGETYHDVPYNENYDGDFIPF